MKFANFARLSKSRGENDSECFFRKPPHSVRGFLENPQLEPEPMKRASYLLALATGLAATFTLAAEQQPEPKKPHAEEIHLVIHPADVPRPAMQIQLLPPLIEQRPGNAAPLYMKAFMLLAQADAPDEAIERADSWLGMPLEELPREEVREDLDRFDSAIHYARMAARRSRCEWELPIHEEGNIFELMLPELSSARNLGRVIALRVRLHIAEGDYGAAIEDLQTGYAMARHVARQPTLVSGLVGIAIADMMTDQLQAMIQAPGVPNLYWTVTALPDPLISLRRAIQLESNSIYLLFPGFEEAMHEEVPPEHWEGVLEQVIRLTRSWQDTITETNGEAPDEENGEEDIEDFIEKAYPIARREVAERRKHQERERRELLKHIEHLEGEIKELEREGNEEEAEELHRHVEELERHAEPPRPVGEMSRAEVVVRHVFATYEELRDNMFKWFHVPYWQAREAIEAAEAHCRRVSKEQEVVPLASVILPAVGACHLRSATSQRRMAALRCVEAIRLFAAEHDGRLPSSLDEIKRVPLPVNPVTGKPFEYRCKVAALAGPMDGATGGVPVTAKFAVLVADGPDRSRRVYRLELAK